MGERYSNWNEVGGEESLLLRHFHGYDTENYEAFLQGGQPMAP